MFVWKNMVLILALFVAMISAESGYCSAAKDRFLLRDGFFLNRVDGKVITTDSNESGRMYFFEFESEVRDGQGQVKAGARLELLPSSALERMIAGFGNDSAGQYRLWGYTTRYRGSNYVFVVSFLPLREKTGVVDSEDGGGKSSEANDANDTVQIPADVLEKLRGRKIRRPTKQEKPASGEAEPGSKSEKRLKLDSVMAGRVGFINGSEQAWAGGWSTKFVLDSSGRGVEGDGFELLPCEALERAQNRQLYEPDRVRFKVSGLVTEFMGTKYLLLQQAVRAYAYGNLGM